MTDSPATVYFAVVLSPERLAQSDKSIQGVLTFELSKRVRSPDTLDALDRLRVAAGQEARRV